MSPTCRARGSDARGLSAGPPGHPRQSRPRAALRQPWTPAQCGTTVPGQHGNLCKRPSLQGAAPQQDTVTLNKRLSDEKRINKGLRIVSSSVTAKGRRKSRPTNRLPGGISDPPTHLCLWVGSRYGGNRNEDHARSSVLCVRCYADKPHAHRQVNGRTTVVCPKMEGSEVKQGGRTVAQHRQSQEPRARGYSEKKTVPVFFPGVTGKRRHIVRTV